MESGGNKNKKIGRRNEILIKDSTMYPIDSYLYDVCPSICKINFSNTTGTGFFIKLYQNDKSLFSLMTNENIITKDMIEKKKKLKYIIIIRKKE